MKKYLLGFCLIVVAAFLAGLFFNGLIFHSEQRKEFDLSYEFDGHIPFESYKDENVPLGIKLPDVENDWRSEDTPIFLYTNPEMWEEVYKVSGEDRHIVKVGRFYLYVTITGNVGPVWAYARYDNFGDLYGITYNKVFLFAHNGDVLAVPQGHMYYPVVRHYWDLPEDEMLSRKRISPVPVRVKNIESLRIDSLDSDDTCVAYSEEIGVEVIANKAYPFYSTELVHLTSGGLFSLNGKSGKRIFHFQEAEFFDGHNPYEAIFVVCLDGDFGDVLRVPISDGPFGYDKYGMYTLEPGGVYIYPYAPIIVDGEFVYSSWKKEFFDQIKEYFVFDEDGLELDENLIPEESI